MSETFNKNMIADTYPISIGLKNDRHDCIEYEFVTELNNLRSGINNRFYCKVLGRYVHVHFGIFPSLGDQPERREMNYMMNGNSTFGARYLYAGNIGSFASSLVSCDKCDAIIKDDPIFLLNSKPCSDCLRLNMMQESSMTMYDPPSNYPSEMVPMQGKLGPINYLSKYLKIQLNFVRKSS